MDILNQQLPLFRDSTCSKNGRSARSGSHHTGLSEQNTNMVKTGLSGFVATKYSITCEQYVQSLSLRSGDWDFIFVRALVHCSWHCFDRHYRQITCSKHMQPALQFFRMPTISLIWHLWWHKHKLQHGPPWLLSLRCFNFNHSMNKWLHPFVQCAMKFPIFNVAAFEVWEWMSDFIPHFTGHVVTYLCWD